MIHDYIAVKKDDFDSFIARPEGFFVRQGKLTKHKNRFSQDSISVKFDKFIYSLLREYLAAKRPDQGAFASKSIFQLVQPHKNYKYILCTDIRNYFDRVTFDLVKEIIGSKESVSRCFPEIQKIYFDTGLRRGLIASPLLSEVVGLKIDGLIYQLVGGVGRSDFHYARYYDDISISSNDKKKLEQLLAQLRSRLLKEFAMELKDKKTFIKFTHGSKVLGLTIHKGNVVVPGKFKNRLRAIMAAYETLPEDDLDSTWDKLSAVGTIIASHHYIINNSDKETSEKYRASISDYYTELTRLEELKDRFIQQEAGENARL